MTIGINTPCPDILDCAVLKRKTLKLNLIFIAMDFFILLAYPFVFVFGIIRLLLKQKETITLAK